MPKQRSLLDFVGALPALPAGELAEDALDRINTPAGVQDRLAALVARIAQLEAALVEERAGTLWAGWSGVIPGDEYFEALARRQLTAEGLLPPA